jgi:transposase-like protein
MDTTMAKKKNKPVDAVYCPDCGTDNVIVDQVRKEWVGNFEVRKVRYVCANLECGYTWEA